MKVRTIPCSVFEPLSLGRNRESSEQELQAVIDRCDQGNIHEEYPVRAQYPAYLLAEMKWIEHVFHYHHCDHGVVRTIRHRKRVIGVKLQEPAGIQPLLL